MLNLHIFQRVRDFIKTLPKTEVAKTKRGIDVLESGMMGLLKVKTLRGKIKELVVGQHRLIFFEVGGTVYVVDVFKKQSRKTPRRIIEDAEKVLQIILNHENQERNGS